LRTGSAEVVEGLASDPWTINGLLVTKQISPWQIRLGTPKWQADRVREGISQLGKGEGGQAGGTAELSHEPGGRRRVRSRPRPSTLACRGSCGGVRRRSHGDR